MNATAWSTFWWTIRAAWWTTAVPKGSSLPTNPDLRRTIEKKLLFTEFRPATMFGQPTFGRVLRFIPAALDRDQELSWAARTEARPAFPQQPEHSRTDRGGGVSLARAAGRSRSGRAAARSPNTCCAAPIAWSPSNSTGARPLDYAGAIRPWKWWKRTFSTPICRSGVRRWWRATCPTTSRRQFSSGYTPWVRCCFVPSSSCSSKWRERLVAVPGTRDYGFLTVQTQLFTRPEILLRVPPEAFSPPPKVDSAAVLLTPREPPVEDVPGFLEFAGRCFRHKRKTLRNNLLPFAAGVWRPVPKPACARNNYRSRGSSISTAGCGRPLPAWG